MTQEELANLKPGDIVMHKSEAGLYQSFIVHENYGNRVTAVATVDITNPIEWECIRKVVELGPGTA